MSVSSLIRARDNDRIRVTNRRAHLPPAEEGRAARYQLKPRSRIRGGGGGWEGRRARARARKRGRERASERRDRDTPVACRAGGGAARADGRGSSGRGFSLSSAASSSAPPSSEARASPSLRWAATASGSATDGGGDVENRALLPELVLCLAVGVTSFNLHTQEASQGEMCTVPDHANRRHLT